MATGCCSCALQGLQRLLRQKPKEASAAREPRLSGRDIWRKGWHVKSNAGKISQFYNLDSKKIGTGSYGTVSKATHKASGDVRAIKTVSKKAASKTVKGLERLQSEIDIMKKMDHPGIIKLYETFEDAQNIYLVMELCSGGELFDHIVKAGHFSESQAAIIMQQMIGAIYYMHENQVAHRDLKPENFLLLSKDPLDSNVLKLIDFGLSRAIVPGQKFTTKAGTPYYVAPQVLQGSYDKAADLWSLGVIMFVLLCGYPPFYGESDAEVLQLVRKGQFYFNPVDWGSVSEDAKNLIRMMLRLNPEERYTAREALSHVWIKEKAPRAARVPLKSGLLDRLRSFRSTNKLKKAALHVIASRMSEEKIRELRQLFISLDTNGDGTLSVPELKVGLANAGLGQLPVDLQQIIEGLDSDGSGAIDYTEFLAATLDTRLYLQHDVLWSAFCVFDRNGDGKISLEELRQVLEDHGVDDMLVVRAQELMAEIDQDGNGEIDFTEFMDMMRGGATLSAPMPARGNTSDLGRRKLPSLGVAEVTKSAMAAKKGKTLPLR